MVKKKGFSDIDMEMLPFFKTKIGKCSVCEEFLSNRSKMVIFDESGNASFFSCLFCNSVYDIYDKLIIVNFGDNVVVGES